MNLIEPFEDFFDNCIDIFFWWTQKKTDSDNAELLEGKNFLELLFFGIVDPIRRVFKSKIDRTTDGYFDTFLIDCIIITFIFLIPFSISIITQPVTQKVNIDAHYNAFVQGLIIILFLSLFWTGYVYINQQFRSLILTKILPILKEHNLKKSLFYQTLFPFFNGGIYLERTYSTFYIRSVVLFGSVSFLTTILFFKQIFLTETLDSIASNLFSFIIVTFLIIIWGYLLISLFLIVVYLILAFRYLPIVINPLLDRGGTETLGNFTMNSLYLSSIATGFVPTLWILIQLNLNWPKISELIHQPFGSITTSVKNMTETSFNNATIDKIFNSLIVSNSFLYIVAFVMFFFLALAMLITLHFRIKQRKTEELKKIENLLTQIDYSQLDDEKYCRKKRNLLYIYDEISNLHEWPTKNLATLGILLSLLPLIISYALSKL